MEAKIPGGAVTLLNDLIEKAVKLDASDIHIEPGESSIRVRYRVDGILQNGILIHRSMLPQLISRIKIMAELDIAEQRLPQDGRTFTKANGREFDLRVSTMPVFHGEKAVLRLLDRKKMTLELDDLGLAKDDLKHYSEIIGKPQGLILVCGPTGCGKTTTLYSSIEKLEKEIMNIITIEDPIEYQIPSINQIQVNNKTGLTFAKGLRSILRQDPDVIMVGEIRDGETASVAVQAAMTGHLVLSTLHTNDAASAVVRLIDMGVEPYLISSTLKCVLSQRLVRKLCATCRGSGCGHCHNTGFKGRTGVFEFMRVSDRVKHLINTKAPAAEICREGGHTTMMENARQLVAGSVTTLDEVVKNVYVE